VGIVQDSTLLVNRVLTVKEIEGLYNDGLGAEDNSSFI